MSENGNGQDNEYGLSVENFISNEYSICREERQYALFLYNVLRYYSTPERREGNEAVRKNIFQYIFTESELKNVVVDYVF